MPNHCENYLRINGSMKEIERMLSEVESSDKLIDANKIIPYPEEYRKLDEIAKAARDKGNFDVEDGYNNGGYQWCVNTWGTKWGMYDFTPIVRYKQSVKLTFLSAWSPPEPIIKQLSIQYPKLTFTLRYYEGGAGFKGVLKCKGYDILEEHTGDYNGNRGG